MARPPRSESAPRAWARLDGTGFTSDEVELGYISGVFGVRGEVRLFLHHRESDLFTKARPVVVLAPGGARYRTTLVSRVGAGKRVLGRFTGLDDRDLAASLKDWRLGIALSDMPALDDGEFYYRDLVRAEVHAGGQRIGTVIQVHETPAADILEIDVGDEESAFVPCLEEFIVEMAPGRVELAEEAFET